MCGSEKYLPSGGRQVSTIKMKLNTENEMRGSRIKFHEDHFYSSGMKEWLHRKFTGIAFEMFPCLI